MLEYFISLSTHVFIKKQQCQGANINNKPVFVTTILIFHNKIYHVLCESPKKLVKLLQSFLDLMPQRIIEKNRTWGFLVQLTGATNATTQKKRSPFRRWLNVLLNIVPIPTGIIHDIKLIINIRVNDIKMQFLKIASTFLKYKQECLYYFKVLLSHWYPSCVWRFQKFP